jgi:hypothetical protein
VRPTRLESSIKLTSLTEWLLCVVLLCLFASTVSCHTKKNAVAPPPPPPSVDNRTPATVQNQIPPLPTDQNETTAQTKAQTGQTQAQTADNQIAACPHRGRSLRGSRFAAAAGRIRVTKRNLSGSSREVGQAQDRRDSERPVLHSSL